MSSSESSRPSRKRIVRATFGWRWKRLSVCPSPQLIWSFTGNEATKLTPPSTSFVRTLFHSGKFYSTPSNMTCRLGESPPDKEESRMIQSKYKKLVWTFARNEVTKLTTSFNALHPSAIPFRQILFHPLQHDLQVWRVSSGQEGKSIDKSFTQTQW
jgi:hypothetical protein